MKEYIVTFECQLPMRIMTKIKANDTKGVIQKIEKKEIQEFQFQTTDVFKELKDIEIIL